MKKHFAFLVLAFCALCAFSPVRQLDSWKSWDYNFDGSVGCENTPPSKEDVEFFPNGETLTLTANSRNVPGLFLNAVAGNYHTWKNKSRYAFYGELRRFPGSRNEHISANLQLVRDYKEHHFEVFWTNNPLNPLFGWVWTRYDLDKPIKLFYLGDDTNWHTFALVADYVAGKAIAKSIIFDNKVFLLDREMGTNAKAWKESFATLIETHNNYTACSPLFSFIGKSQWKNIELNRISLQK